MRNARVHRRLIQCIKIALRRTPVGIFIKCATNKNRNCVKNACLDNQSESERKCIGFE